MVADVPTPRTGGGAGGPALPGGPPLVEVRGVDKRYGGVQALAGVDLDLRAGEVVALAGENGSGKSTLAKVLAGLVRPDAGRVRVGGADLAPGDPRASGAAGIALVSQELTSLPHLTVGENVLLSRSDRPWSAFDRRRTWRDATPYLRRVGLAVDPRRPMGSLGAGDREMVEVAKALAREPRVLLLDEATARLPDPERLFAVVEALAAGGTAVVFVTHRLPEIRRLAGRAVVLRDGRLVGELPASRLSDAALTAMMVGRELADLFPARASAGRRGVDEDHEVPGRPVLEVDRVVTTRGPAELSLTVHAGEVVGLAGLVGAGRSELLETVAGARPRRGGRVRVLGRQLSGRSPAEARAAGVGFVPEDRFAQALIPTASIVTNLAMPTWRRWRRTDLHGDVERARRVVRAFRIRCGGVDAPVRTLSGGTAQKVVIARCLEGRPRVLLLDEPTRGVDVGARAEIYELLVDAAASGVGVLLASSDLPELLGLCDRIVVMADGAVVGELPRERATEESVAVLALGGAPVATAGGVA